MQQPRSSGGVTAAALAVVGGVVAMAGSLLSWAKASVGPSSFSAKGIDGWEGKVTIVAGVVMLVVGASALVGAEGARARRAFFRRSPAGPVPGTAPRRRTRSYFPAARSPRARRVLEQASTVQATLTTPPNPPRPHRLPLRRPS
jgi:hypothetical protein